MRIAVGPSVPRAGNTGARGGSVERSWHGHIRLGRGRSTPGHHQRWGPPRVYGCACYGCPSPPRRPRATAPRSGCSEDTRWGEPPGTLGTSRRAGSCRQPRRPWCSLRVHEAPCVQRLSQRALYAGSQPRPSRQGSSVPRRWIPPHSTTSPRRGKTCNGGYRLFPRSAPAQCQLPNSTV